MSEIQGARTVFAGVRFPGWHEAAQKMLPNERKERNMTDTIETNGVATAETTTGEFLAALPIWTVVQSQGGTGTRYVWTGSYATEGETRFALLVDPSGSINRFATTNPNRFGVGVERVSATELEQRLILQAVRLRESNTELRTWQGNAQQDWAILQEKLNDYAVNRGWCSEYDRIVEGWNPEFTVFELRGRDRDYMVEVEVVNRWTVQVPVRGVRDEDAARNHVDDMTWEQILSAAGDRPTTPDDTEIDIQDVSIED